jgi:hypothetical protein
MNMFVKVKENQNKEYYEDLIRKFVNGQINLSNDKVKQVIELKNKKN